MFNLCVNWAKRPGRPLSKMKVMGSIPGLEDKKINKTLKFVIFGLFRSLDPDDVYETSTFVNFDPVDDHQLRAW